MDYSDRHEQGCARIHDVLYWRYTSSMVGKRGAYLSGNGSGALEFSSRDLEPRLYYPRMNPGTLAEVNQKSH